MKQKSKNTKQTVQTRLMQLMKTRAEGRKGTDARGSMSS